MAYDELLADRIRNTLKKRQVAFIEKKMMGGLTFMVDDKMCVGIIKNELMARIDPGFQEEAIAMDGCRIMDFTKRPMNGYVLVHPKAIDLEVDLEFWILKALEFNPKAKSSRKK